MDYKFIKFHDLVENSKNNVEETAIWKVKTKVCLFPLEGVN